MNFIEFKKMLEKDGFKVSLKKDGGVIAKRMHSKSPSERAYKRLKDDKRA